MPVPGQGERILEGASCCFALARGQHRRPEPLFGQDRMERAAEFFFGDGDDFAGPAEGLVTGSGEEPDERVHREGEGDNVRLRQFPANLGRQDAAAWKAKVVAVLGGAVGPETTYLEIGTVLRRWDLGTSSAPGSSKTA